MLCMKEEKDLLCASDLLARASISHEGETLLLAFISLDSACLLCTIPLVCVILLPLCGVCFCLYCCPLSMLTSRREGLHAFCFCLRREKVTMRGKGGGRKEERKEGRREEEKSHCRGGGSTLYAGRMPGGGEENHSQLLCCSAWLPEMREEPLFCHWRMSFSRTLATHSLREEGRKKPVSPPNWEGSAAHLPASLPSCLQRGEERPQRTNCDIYTPPFLCLCLGSLGEGGCCCMGLGLYYCLKGLILLPHLVPMPSTFFATILFSTSQPALLSAFLLSLPSGSSIVSSMVSHPAILGPSVFSSLYFLFLPACAGPAVRLTFLACTFWFVLLLPFVIHAYG